MTLFNLAIRNVKRNFKNYFLYFASMIFSIVMYYTFVSLKYNSQIEKAADASTKISGGFSVSSVLLILFVALFMIYSNGFFTRKRKKEVGLYSLLGLRKKQIGKMLFYENLCMGLISLMIGILIGALLSKAFLSLLLVLMGLDLHVTFEIPVRAVLQTFAVFFLIILYTSFQGYRLIYRFKLIELFSAEKEGEGVPKGSWLMAAVAILFIATGYTMALFFMKIATKGLGLLPLAFAILFFTVTGTYMLFHFFTVAMLKRAKKKKRSFYKGMNIFSTSQLLYRIKGNATSLATISVLSAVTLCAVGFSATVYISTFQTADQMRPFSYSYVKKDKHLDEKVNAALNREKANHPVTNDVALKTVFVKGEVSGVRYISNIRYMIDEGFHLMPESEFHSYMKQIGKSENVHLKPGEVFAVDGSYDDNLSGFDDSYVHKSVQLNIGKSSMRMKIKGAGAYYLSDFGEFVLVVPDHVFDRVKQTGKERVVRNITVKNERDSEALSNNLAKAVKNSEQYSDYYHLFSEGLQSSGLMIFIGVFLGLVFLLATGSIIYFKQMMEAAADKPQYDILQKVGVTNQEKKRAIRKQMAFVFTAPLILGVLHTLFALKALEKMMPVSVAIPIFICVPVYILIYFSYYEMTVRSYYKEVS